MKRVFADTSYWIAILWFEDQWRAAALRASENHRNSEIFTTELILIEVLNYFSEFRADIKDRVINAVEQIFKDEDTTVLLHNHEDFLKALGFYKLRLDKGYGLTDCASMNAMRELGIAEILSNDRHFEQEGFTKLF